MRPDDDELVISKQYPSAFFGTSLSSTLASQGIDTLILTGLTTSRCVQASCVDASSHGFIPNIAEPIIGAAIGYLELLGRYGRCGRNTDDIQP